MEICTIIARNYAPFARVLAESFRAQHPEGRCWVLVIDDIEGRMDSAAEPFEVVRPRDLDIARFDQMAALYTVLELSTAVKPWFLRYLLARPDIERIVYLDPDIRVFASLAEVDDLLREHHTVVTPHLTEPMPRDGHRPSETDILIAGAYNLGFVGLSRADDTDRLLQWWSERLERDCIVAPERGYFVDQRWFDFAPGLVPSFRVLRDPGYNVAYWNLSGRSLAREGDRYVVNGGPLRFFHYSGYDPEKPWQLSKHQDRIRLQDDPVLQELCDLYGAELLERGFRNDSRIQYAFDRLPNGLRLDAVVRDLYRQAESSGAVRRSVFSQEGADELREWLMAPAPEGAAAGVTRYAHGIRQRRPDLQAAFPDLDGADGHRFRAWAEVYAAVDGQQLSVDAAAKLNVGVNVVGYFNSVLGVGEVARQVVGALKASEVPVSTTGLVPQASQQGEEFHIGGEGAVHPINLICVNADALPGFVDEMGEQFLAGRHSIGYWWWEVNRFPERWMESFRHVDEVWVGSHHVADALAAVSPVPVVRMPMPVTVPTTDPLDRSALLLPDGFLFLFMFDYNSVFERKNPIGLVEAFSTAFPPGSGASLVIKSINHERDPRNHRRLVEAIDGRPDIHLVDRYVSRREKDSLVAACDSYVSLHRSEGFGITLAEAMLLGKPVVATGYSGNVDFMTPQNGYLVDHRVVPIGEGADPYPPEGEWAEPDVEHAAALMRRVFEHRDEAAERGRRAGADIARHYSPATVGQAMRDRLERTFLSSVTQHGGAGARIGTVDVSRLERRVRGGPGPAAPGRFGRAQAFARRVMLRLIKPFTVHQRMVDEDMLRAIRGVDDGLQGTTLALVRQIDELRAQLGVARDFIDSFGLTGGAIHNAEISLDAYPVAPDEPWTPEYVERHREFLSRALDEPRLLLAFKQGRPLPRGYGVGFDERMVEYPWLFTRDVRGRALDAGSVLNHPHVALRFRPRVDDLHIVTLAPEPQAYPFLDISYLYADLRDLPMDDDAYDTVISVSTLEHVGFDNTQYGARGGTAGDPDRDMLAAVRELRRVLRPGGTLFLTVPYGRRQDFDWLRQFSAETLSMLTEDFRPAAVEQRYYRYGGDGWQPCSREEADDAEYRDHFSASGPAPDRAVAARAVACLELVK